MIFGISVSDIYGCARLAYVLYDEFKQAPGACREFAQDLLLFHQVLLKTKSTIESEASHLSDSDEAALSACLDRCKELLYVQTVGAHMMPIGLEKIDIHTLDPESDISVHNGYGKPRFLRGLRQKFGERKFASQIPKLQRAITALVEKLTAFNVLIIQSHQGEIQDSQEHIKERIGESHDLLEKSSADQALQLITLRESLETSQARIELQLQAILANQQRSRTPITSQSLDASSPQGRETWMELGKLLREEGITPAVIHKNRGVLINAMKSALEKETLALESSPGSYLTAPEYHADISTPSSAAQPRIASRPCPPSVLSPISLLGSAPPRSSGFTDAFLRRQKGATSSLDQEQNVNDGMQSLLQGMSSDFIVVEPIQADIDDRESEDVELKGIPINLEENQTQIVKDLMEPLFPTLKPGESTAKLEVEEDFFSRLYMGDFLGGLPSRRHHSENPAPTRQKSPLLNAQHKDPHSLEGKITS